MALENFNPELENQFAQFKAPSSLEAKHENELAWKPTEGHEPFKSLEPTDPIFSSPEKTKEALIQQLVEFRGTVRDYVAAEQDAASGKPRAKELIAEYGSLINKHFTETMKIADATQDTQLVEVVFSSLSRELEAILVLPAAGKLYANRRAGAVAEWAVAKTLNDGCYVDVFSSTVEEDMLAKHGNVDMWATPGNSEYSGFAESPELTWAIQVKSNADIEQVYVLSADDMQGAFSTIDSLDCSPGRKDAYKQSLEHLSRAQNRFTNVTPVLILVPDFTMSPGYIDNKTGMPRAPFEAAMDEALSDISDSKLAA